VEPPCSGEHTRYITRLHNEQLAVHICEADGSLVPRLGGSGVGGFAEELRGPGTEPPQGFKKDCAECIHRAVVVEKVVPALVCIPKSSGMARGAGGGTNVGSSQGMDEGDVSKNMAGPGAQVAVEVPACLGAVGGARLKPGVSPFSTRRETQATHELAQNFRCLFVAGLHETAEPVEAQSLGDLVILDGVAAGARPARAGGEERSHSPADAACFLKELVV
jgi:hypothetical protein